MKEEKYRGDTPSPVSPRFRVNGGDSGIWSGFYHKHDHRDGRGSFDEDPQGSLVPELDRQVVRGPGIFSVTVSRFQVTGGSQNPRSRFMNSWRRVLTSPGPDNAHESELEFSEPGRFGMFSSWLKGPQVLRTT